MTDFHSHILPALDDGSKSAEQSVQMLSMYSKRITDIFFTPHFYPDCNTPERFLQERKAAYERLLEKTEGAEYPHFHLGAEVAYYEGIHRNPLVKELHIEGTNLILVEMPQSTWTTRMMDELLEIRREWGICPVLAHIDRYSFGKGEYKKGFEHYLENGGLVQVNCEAILSFFSRQTAVRMIREGKIHFIGSDAHNMSSRMPQMDKVIDLLSGSSAKDVLEIISGCEEEYIGL